VGIVILGALLFWFGGYLLIASDTLPPHVEGAVVLQGSIAADNARLDGAVRLVEAGTANRVILSVPKEAYWGESSIPAARTYMERKYGSGIAGRVEFCETGPEVNSTDDEAKVVTGCIRDHGWKTIVVVTSNYHTRRAGMIWRKVMRAEYPAGQVWIHAVSDPEFEPSGWWRRRIYAKTTFLEVTKLVWTILTRS
jgi:uncharacterized SAM-binding protein YcdF (DUF218 family)